jgi:hypothetical protein
VRDKIRPRIERQRQAAEQLEALAELENQMATSGALSGEERAVLDRVRNAVRGVYEGTAPGRGANHDAILADMGRRLELLPDWVNLSRHVDTLEPPQLREDLRKELAPVRDYLLASGTADEASAKAAEATLRAMPDKIEQALRAHLIERIEEFSRQVKNERAAHPSDDKFLELIEDTVQKRLEESRRLANADQLALALAAFEDARTRYVDLLATELKLRLDAARPGWLEDAAWARLQTAVRAELARLDAAATPEQKLAAYEQSQALYLRETARTLGEAVQAVLATRSLPVEARPFLEKAAMKSQNARSRATVLDLHGADASFREAEAAWNEYQAWRLKAGFKLGVGTPTSPASPPGGVPLGLTVAPIRANVGRGTRILSSRTLGARLGFLDSVITIVAALFAVYLGVQLLWEPDLTWGTTGDKFAALLWGLGLQQAGNETFRGVADLVGRVGGGASQKVT